MLQRDISRILEALSIQISHKRNAGYYIEYEDDENSFLRFEELFADFDLLTAVNPDSKVNQYLLPEHNRGKGSENLYPLLHAIKNRSNVSFEYTFVRHGDRVGNYEVSPYFLKESQNRWYLVAKHDGKLKTFGIDRITGLNILDVKYKPDLAINADNLFFECYGIWDNPDTPVEDIVLKYDALDGKFLKSLPLHHSQKVLVDNEDEFRISLRLKITNDFKMALLARSRSLEVLAPAHLREYIASVATECGKRNM